MIATAAVLERHGRMLRELAEIVSLHSRNPGLTGAYEVNAAKYQRQTVEWTEGGRNQYSLRFNLERLDGEPVHVAWIGFWSADGVFQFAAPTDPVDCRDDYVIDQRMLRARVEAG